ncbi:HCP-like protein [Sordaria brevicollis]|uniref:HCP-like protein n=1 Tax=Sordaria brevicollis TaxID=83679 RepID=A0AAE0PD28_SORBR|nr:HCP-like protein [Sordaria brevicollis]
MAAVTASPVASPTSTTTSPRRKPVPTAGLPAIASIERFEWNENAPSLPGVSLAESPRIRQSPISPVKVNFQPENWAQPSNANIETDRSYDGLQPVPGAFDRALPATPGAPTPPPHTPLNEQPRQDTSSYPAAPSAQSAWQDTEKPLPGLELPSVARLKLEASQDDLSSDSSRASHGRITNRRSRESDTTVSTSKQPNSNDSSAATSASSVSGVIEASDCPDNSGDISPESSILEDGSARAEQVPQLAYHHSAFMPRPASMAVDQDPRARSNSSLVENGGPINRHLTPNSFNRRSSVPRPQSAYSVYSDFGSRGHSPGLQNRTPSANSRNSPDNRPQSFAELLNVPYPQPAPAPLTLDNSNLRSVVGNNASLLSAQKTLEMYRQNVRKTTDYSTQYSFAVFLINTAQEQGLNFDELRKSKSPKPGRSSENLSTDGNQSSPYELVREARAILQKLSNNGFPFAQYYLADGYASGLFNKGKEDYNSAFPLFVLAAKHGHAESAYRTALCYEFGWGCRKDPAKAVQFLRTAASKRHPGAMTRLGKACLSGDLGEKRYREGVKWLKLATESADAIYNAAPYQLGCLYETGYGDDIFKDESYAAELFTQAADLGNPDANYRMGDAYEHGKLNCPRDPALSVHFYTGAAERGHAAAMMGLCAWYLVGADPILEKDEEEAYEWAKRSAELGYVKAQYAVGYFTEMGIGCRRDILEANLWYVKAAEAGDERAKQRLAVIRAAVSGGTPMEVAPARNAKIRKSADKDDKECIVM